MDAVDRSRVIGLAEALSAIPSGEKAVVLLRHGTLDVKLAFPESPNRQTTHAQDEIYVALRGRGVLVHDGRRDAFGPGDLLFVAAGVDHHFEEFGEDLLVWRVFYGPAGGDVPGDTSP